MAKEIAQKTATGSALDFEARLFADGTPVAGQQFTYNFDDIGNRKRTAAGGDGNGLNLRTANYTANNLNQYTSRDVPGYATVLGSANPKATVTVNLQRAYRYGSYFWDELSENNAGAALYVALTNLAVLNNGTNADIVATNTGNVLLPQTPETFGYDADGNLTNSGRWTVAWDAENRALSFATIAGAPAAGKRKVDCAYDFQGRRVQKIVSTNNGSAWIPVSTNKYVYDGWNLVAILNSDFSLLSSFQWGTDLSGSLQGAGGVGGLLSLTVAAGTNAGTYFYSHDGNGNVAALVNAANGALAAQYEYDPFLGVTRASGALAFVNPFLGSSKFFDAETGLYYYGYRYYDPSTGRWPNRDPSEEEGGINLYQFVGNNPINYFDLLGLAPTIYPNNFVGPLPPDGIYQASADWIQQAEGHGVADLSGDFFDVATLATGGFLRNGLESAAIKNCSKRAAEEAAAKAAKDAAIRELKQRLEHFENELKFFYEQKDGAMHYIAQAKNAGRSYNDVTGVTQELRAAKEGIDSSIGQINQIQEQLNKLTN